MRWVASATDCSAKGSKSALGKHRLASSSAVVVGDCCAGSETLRSAIPQALPTHTIWRGAVRVQVGFAAKKDADPESVLFVLNRIVDLAFLVDCILSFFTAFQWTNGTWCYYLNTIQRRYLYGW